MKKTTAWTRDELEEMAYERRRASAPAHAFTIRDEDAAMLHAMFRPRAFDVVALDPRAIATRMATSIEANRAVRQFGEALGGVTAITRGRLAEAMAAMDRAVEHPWSGTADEWTQAIEKRDVMRKMMGLLVASPESRAYVQPPLTIAMRRDAIRAHLMAIEGDDVEEHAEMLREIAGRAAPRTRTEEPIETLRRDLVRKLASALASAGSTDVDALARIAEAVSRL